MKKVLSLVLVIAMVLSSFSFAFAAPTYEDIADTDYEEAIEMLSALGIIDGYEDGTFKPERTITRAEMAKLMVVTLGYGDLVAGAKSNFADTQGHWADAWIALAAGRGIVIGDGDGKFRPDAVVSYDEAITMLVRGLGYTDDCNELKGMSWPTNFKVKAAELDITDGVAMSAAGADRGGVAQLIANALEATLVSVTTDGDVTFLKDKIGGKDYDKLLITRVAERDVDYVVSTDKVDPKNKNFAGEVVFLTPYIYQSLEVYLNDDDQVVYIKDVNSLVYEGEIDEVYENNGGVVVAIEEADGDIEKVRFDSVAADDTIAKKVFLNGWPASGVTYEYLERKTVEDVKIVANDANDDGSIQESEVQGFVVTERTKLVRIEREYVEGKDSLDGIKLPVDSKDDVDLRYILVTGDAESLEDIAEDDIVVAYASQDTEAIMLVVTRNAVEGKVTRIYDADTFYIDGKSYDVAALALETDFDLGDEGVFYLDQNGEIADYDGEGVGPQDYAVIIGASNGDVELKFGKYSVDTYPELKLATQGGAEVIYEVAVEVKKDDGKIDNSAEISKSKEAAIDEGDIFPVAGYEAGDGAVLNIEKFFYGDPAVYKAYLVKYSLDKNGRIDDLEIVKDVTAYENKEATGLNKVDQDKDSILDSVVVFDAGDDYDVVDLDSLDTEFVAYAVEDKNGDIEVLVVKAGEVDDAATTIYAYLNRVTLAYDNDGDKVNQYVMYVDGAKKEIFADDDIADAKKYNQVISFDYNGNAIDESDVDFTPVGYAATATAINASRGRIELDVEVKTDGWYDLSEHATILLLEADKDVDKILDLYDIDKGDTFTVYINDDGDIDLIIVQGTK
jgi:hypothetical protein